VWGKQKERASRVIGTFDPAGSIQCHRGFYSGGTIPVLTCVLYQRLSSMLSSRLLQALGGTFDDASVDCIERLDVKHSKARVICWKTATTLPVDCCTTSCPSPRATSLEDCGWPTSCYIRRHLCCSCSLSPSDSSSPYLSFKLWPAQKSTSIQDIRERVVVSR